MLGQDVVRAAGADAVGLGARRPRRDRRGRRAERARPAPTSSSTARRAPTSTAPRAEPAAAARGQRRGARNVAAAAAPRGRSTSRPTTSSTGPKPDAVRRVGPDRVRCRAYGRSKLAGERATLAANPRSFDRPHVVAVRRGGGNFVETMLDWARSATSSASSTTRSAARPTRATSPRRWCGSRRRRSAYGVHPHGRGPALLLVRVRARDLRAARASTCACSPARTDEFPRPAPPARLLGARGASAARLQLPAWQEGLDAYLGVRAHEAARDRRGRLHRLDLRADGRPSDHE